MAGKVNGQYQMFDALRPEELGALEKDILERGIMVPIEVDEKGHILDGHSRFKIAKKHGIKYKEVTRRFKTEEEKKEHILKMNLLRRHLDPLAWGIAFKKLLTVRGVRRGKGGNNRTPTTSDVVGATVKSSAKEFGVNQRTAEDRLRLADKYDILPSKQQKKVDKGEVTIPQATREVQREVKRVENKKKAIKHPPQSATCRVIHGDCREELQKRKAGSVRLIFADPPYNLGVDYGEGVEADEREYDEYLGWCGEWIEHCVTRLTDDGSLWLMINDEWAAHMSVLLTKSWLTHRSWIKWYETFGVNCSNNFNRCSRHIFYCVKDPENFVFNADAVRRSSDRQTKHNDKRADPGGKIWDNVWEIPRLVENSKERIPDFPTQIPLAIMRAIVGCASNPGDTVLDPFSGSASTGVAAIESGREYIGIEKNKNYCRLSKQRLQGVCDDVRRTAAV